MDKRLRANLRQMGDFSRVHPLPQSGQDVPDDMDARLVVLGPDFPYSRGNESRAETAAKAIFESRGNTPRLFRNTLVFLTVDQTRLQDLDEAVRYYLAWEWIVAEAEQETLDFSPHQRNQAKTQKTSADSVVTARLPEAYQWLLVPVQENPQASVAWQAFRLSGGQDAPAVRASKKLKNDELLVPVLAGTPLKMDLDCVPLWRGDHVSIRQLAEDFARYLYLPRLVEHAVLRCAIEDGLGLLTWASDSFAYADSYDEATGRYRGLRGGQRIAISDADAGLLVRPDVARKQMENEASPAPMTSPTPSPGPEIEPLNMPIDTGPTSISAAPNTPDLASQPRRFYGSVTLDSTRVGRDAGRIADEVIAHLVGLVGSTVKVTLEIEADIPSGTPDHVVRTVTENSRTLKFTIQGFETE